MRLTTLWAVAYLICHYTGSFYSYSGVRKTFESLALSDAKQKDAGTTKVQAKYLLSFPRLIFKTSSNTTKEYYWGTIIFCFAYIILPYRHFNVNCTFTPYNLAMLPHTLHVYISPILHTVF